MRQIRADSRRLVSASCIARLSGGLTLTSGEGYGRVWTIARAQRREDSLTESAESVSERDNTMPQTAPTREVNVGNVGNGMFRVAEFM